MRVLEILEEVARDNSRLHKEAVLREHADHNDLKNVVRLALDPLTQFYIRKIPDYGTFPDCHCSLTDGLERLGVLSRREKTGNAGVEHLTNILIALHPDDSTVIERIIAKDLRCGVAAATANKIWPKLIPEYPVMLCEPFTEKLIAKFTWPALVQLKADGMRFNAIVKDGHVEFRSRNGKSLDLKGELEADFLKAIHFGKDGVFDGELLAFDSQGNILDRKTGNGILNKANKGTISVKEAKMVHAVIWDIIGYEDFINEESLVPYSIRYESLLQMDLSDRIHVIETHPVSDFQSANAFFEAWLARGQEGAILKDRTAPWVAKRSQKCIKLKAELECDLLCIGWNEGTGQNKGLLGAVECESSDRVIKVGVGTGFSKKQRESIKPKDIVGKILSIKYNARINNKEGGESLFLPVFVEIREDKDMADHSRDIR